MPVCAFNFETTKNEYIDLCKILYSKTAVSIFIIINDETIITTMMVIKMNKFLQTTSFSDPDLIPSPPVQPVELHVPHPVLQFESSSDWLSNNGIIFVSFDIITSLFLIDINLVFARNCHFCR